MHKLEIRKGTRADLLTFAGVLLFITAAVVVGVVAKRYGVPIHAGLPPLFAQGFPHLGVGTILAIAFAAAAIRWGFELAQRLPWRRLLAVAWAAAIGWTVSLGLVDGWHRLVTRLDGPPDFLHEVANAPWPNLLPGFADRIAGPGPDGLAPWTTHVAGHPPGSLAYFIVLDRIGLGGGVWASISCILLGASAVAAVAVTFKALGYEEMARRALPFLVLAPAAIWVGVSADATYLGISAWGLALLAMATTTTGPRRWMFALTAGLLLGFSLYLSYGLVLFGLLALAILLLTRDWRAISIAGASVLSVIVSVTIGGFAWWEGYFELVDRYYAGWGGERPYWYWVWADVAALLVCTGPLIPVALRRFRLAFYRTAKNSWQALPIAAGLAVLGATLSGLSKAEVERIWLPFALWLVAACAVLPDKSRKRWLATQVIAALVVQHFLLTRW